MECTLWAYPLGFLYSILVGHVAIHQLVKNLHASVGWKKSDVVKARPHETVVPAMIGILERALYTASIVIDKPEFIAVWLAMKVAGQWSVWSENTKVASGVVSGRAIFNVFLVGNGFSIAYGAVGALGIRWFIDHRIELWIGVPFLLVLGTVGFSIWAKRASIGQ